MRTRSFLGDVAGGWRYRYGCREPECPADITAEDPGGLSKLKRSAGGRAGVAARQACGGVRECGQGTGRPVKRVGVQHPPFAGNVLVLAVQQHLVDRVTMETAEVRGDGGAVLVLDHRVRSQGDLVAAQAELVAHVDVVA
jgi:hypothetical protein